MPWLVHDSKVLATLEVADSITSRSKGLLGRDGIEGALLLSPARSVHTVRMRFAIDVAFLDADHVVLRIVTMAAQPGQPADVAGPLGDRGRGRLVRPLEPPPRRPARDPRHAVSGGALVLVATPIGNLGDLSPRAVAELGRADVVACEDTRRTGRLLAHAGVTAPKLLDRERPHRGGRGRRRAGPARPWRAGGGGVRCRHAGHLRSRGAAGGRGGRRPGTRSRWCPGPSAAVAALVISGLPTGRFVFEGFLPRKGSGRSERLVELAGERRTIVLYEAPHRLARTLADLAAALRHRPAAWRWPASSPSSTRRSGGARWPRRSSGAPRSSRGASTCWSSPVPRRPVAATDDELAAAVAEEIRAGRSTRDAVALVSGRFDVSRRRVYDLATRA